MKIEDIIKYDDSFKELADILERKEDTELLNLSSFDTFVQDIFSLSYPQFSFRSWHIRKICSFIDDVLNSENKMAVMALPRYHLKSTISGHALILYRFLKCFGDAFYCSYKDELAGIHLSNMKREVESNPILSKIMTDLKTRSETGIHYKIGNKKVRLYSAGVFSVKRGIHVDSVVVSDDLLGTVENPMTLGELEKAERMFNQEIINIPNKGCPLIVFGTTIDYSDLLFKLKDNSEFMNLWMPAIHPDTEHEVLWDDVFDKKTLEIKKRASGWKAFSTEFLLTPVSATEAFLTREEIDRVIDTNLKSLSIFRKFEKEGRNVVAGLDIGKRRNPSHLSVFVSDENDNLVQICQEFWDEMEYIEQVKNIEIAIENFGIDKMFIDATRGEMEERGLPRECILIKFTGRGGRNQQSYATDFAKYVENKRIRLIDDDRFISQIVCMRNDLKAPNSPWGHGDSFWSVALAVGAFQDFYAKGRRKGFSYLGNLTESFEEKKIDIMKDDNVCKICNRRAFETLEDGRIKCKNCGVLK